MARRLRSIGKEALHRARMQRLMTMVELVLIVGGIVSFVVFWHAGATRGRFTTTIAVFMVLSACITGIGWWLRRHYDNPHERFDKQATMIRDEQRRQEDIRILESKEQQLIDEESEERRLIDEESMQTPANPVNMDVPAGTVQQPSSSETDWMAKDVVPTIDDVIMHYGITGQTSVPSKGSPSVFLSQADPHAIEHAQEDNLLFGNAGVKPSGNEIPAVRNLATIVASLGLPMYTFWNMKGLPFFDGIIVGPTAQGGIALFLVKAWDGSAGSAITYSNVLANTEGGFMDRGVGIDDIPEHNIRLVGIDTEARRFLEDGHHHIAQRLGGPQSTDVETWARMVSSLGLNVTATGLVTAAPDAEQGAPRFAPGTVWPVQGSDQDATMRPVDAIDIDDLVSRLRATFAGGNLEAIPANLVHLLSRYLLDWTPGPSTTRRFPVSPPSRRHPIVQLPRQGHDSQACRVLAR